MKKVLIAGGAGFIGSHLIKRLLEEGNEVVAIDNLVTGSHDNIRESCYNLNFTWLRNDIVDYNSYNHLSGIDEIYNLACPASPVHYMKQAISTLNTCFLGTRNLLEFAITSKHGKCKFLQASTSEVYGDPHVHPQVESYYGNVNSYGPRACYDEGKRVAEALIYEYTRRFNLDTRIARIFNTYGPNMAIDDGRVVSNFIVQAIRNEDITINGDGTQTRSFCYVDDLVDGLIKLMASDTRGPVNLGNPIEFTVSNLAAAVIHKIPKTKSKVVYHSIPKDDPMRRKPDISKAKKILAWEPKISLYDGLDPTIDYFNYKITGKIKNVPLLLQEHSV